MEDLKLRLRERTAETLDWIDYRPDPHWWPVPLLAIAIVVGAWILPTTLWLVALIGTAVLVAVLALGLFAVVGITIGLRALIDTVVYRRVPTFRGHRRATLWRYDGLNSRKAGQS